MRSAGTLTEEEFRRAKARFAALFICAGAGLLVYLLLWLFVPSE
jgi:hypothetical protein